MPGDFETRLIRVERGLYALAEGIKNAQAALGLWQQAMQYVLQEGTLGGGLCTPGGTIEGHVTLNGAAWEGVTVTATGANPGTTTTDSTGFYSFPVTSAGATTVSITEDCVSGIHVISAICAAVNTVDF